MVSENDWATANNSSEELTQPIAPFSPITTSIAAWCSMTQNAAQQLQVGLTLGNLISNLSISNGDNYKIESILKVGFILQLNLPLFQNN
jgi:hypothetical protein